MKHLLYNINNTELSLWNQFGKCKKFMPLIGSGDKEYSQYRTYRDFTHKYVFPQKDILKIEKQLQLQATIFRAFFENQYLCHIKEQFLKYDVDILFDFSDIKSLLNSTLSNIFIVQDSKGSRLLSALLTQVIYEYCTDRYEVIEDTVKQIIDIINNKAIGCIYTKKLRTSYTVEITSPDDELVFLSDNWKNILVVIEELYDKLFHKNMLPVNKQITYDELNLNKNDLVNIFIKVITVF